MSIFQKLFGKNKSENSKQSGAPGSNPTSNISETGHISPTSQIGTLICIPGPWKDRSEFVQSVARAGKGKFLFAGMIMMETDAQRHVEVDFYDYDPNMLRTLTLFG